MSESLIRGTKKGFTVIYNSALRDTVRRCLKELEAAGYLIREQAHQENGRFGGAVYTLLSEAEPVPEPETQNEETGKSLSPLTEKPTTVKPMTGNRTQENKHSSKKTGRKHPMAPQGAKSADCLFEEFWNAYPRKENRAAALRAWKKLAPDLELCYTMAAALEWQRETAQWNRDGGQFIPFPASWLRGRRWEDEPGPADRGVRYLEEEGHDGI